MANNTQSPQKPAQAPKAPGAYKKTPMWVWVLVYLVVAAVVYYVVYWMFFR